MGQGRHKRKEYFRQGEGQREGQGSVTHITSLVLVGSPRPDWVKVTFLRGAETKIKSWFAVLEGQVAPFWTCFAVFTLLVKEVALCEAAGYSRERHGLCAVVQETRL